MKKPLAPLALALTRFVVGAAAALIAGAAGAQDYNAMIQQSMARMNAIVGQAEQRAGQIVQQRMQDPAVQAAWQQYAAAHGGRPPMNYPTFTYYYVYTNGFSSAGMAHMRANEAGIQQREAAAWQGLQQAQAARAAAQQGQRDAYYANQQEAGRQLMGQSTYVAPNGYRLQLPHTWQPGTTVQYQGQVYHVDEGGRYYIYGNGGWYPLAAGR